MSDTPRIDDDNREYPLPEHAQHIQFEGCDCVVLSPEGYDELFTKARALERETATLRSDLAAAKERAEKAERERDETIARIAVVEKQRDDEKWIAQNLQFTVDRLHGEKQTAKSELSASRSTIVTCEKQMGIQRAKLDAQESELTTLRTRLADFAPAPTHAEATKPRRRGCGNIQCDDYEVCRHAKEHLHNFSCDAGDDGDCHACQPVDSGDASPCKSCTGYVHVFGRCDIALGRTCNAKNGWKFYNPKQEAKP